MSYYEQSKIDYIQKYKELHEKMIAEMEATKNNLISKHGSEFETLENMLIKNGFEIISTSETEGSSSFNTSCIYTVKKTGNAFIFNITGNISVKGIPYFNIQNTVNRNKNKFLGKELLNRINNLYLSLAINRCWLSVNDICGMNAEFFKLANALGNIIDQNSIEEYEKTRKFVIENIKIIKALKKLG